jgi:sialate O-acetylesterase
MMIKILTSLLLSLWMAASVSAVDQPLSLAAPFMDNMSLQRQTDVPVWGFDTPGSKVIVSFAVQIKTAVADKNGDWMVKLSSLKAP